MTRLYTAQMYLLHKLSVRFSPHWRVYRHVVHSDPKLRTFFSGWRIPTGPGEDLRYHRNQSYNPRRQSLISVWQKWSSIGSEQCGMTPTKCTNVQFTVKWMDSVKCYLIINQRKCSRVWLHLCLRDHMCHQERLLSTQPAGVIKWKHFRAYWPFVRGIQSPVNSPHKGQWGGAVMFSLICTLTIGWVNNWDAGYLRRYRAHYDVLVMVD